MGPPGGARNPVDPRFQSLFNVFEIQFPSTDNLRTIYHSILISHATKLPQAIAEVAETIPDATLELYHHIVDKLPPTPSRFHYIFNLRDLSRVFEGLLLSTPDKFHDAAGFVRLWRNEALRVFRDRLISDEDREVVSRKAKDILQHRYAAVAEAATADPSLFGDFRTTEAAPELRLYEDLGGYDQVQATFQTLLEEYNSTKGNKPMALVFF